MAQQMWGREQGKMGLEAGQAVTQAGVFIKTGGWEGGLGPPPTHRLGVRGTHSRFPKMGRNREKCQK